MVQNRLSPSILSADFAQLKPEFDAAKKGGADMLHLDIMDGHFVPNLTFGPPVVEMIRKATDIILDCHMMVNNPEEMIPLFAQAGVDHITVHAESSDHLDRLVQQIKELGCTAGLALNPATPLESIKHLIPELDMVLIMSVNPGFGGQKLIPYCLDKARTLRQEYPELDIQMDGGVKLDNLKEVMDSGVSNVVAGSAIFGAGDVAELCQKFKAGMK